MNFFRKTKIFNEKYMRHSNSDLHNKRTFLLRVLKCTAFIVLTVDVCFCSNFSSEALDHPAGWATLATMDLYIDHLNKELNSEGKRRDFFNSHLIIKDGLTREQYVKSIVDEVCLLCVDNYKNEYLSREVEWCAKRARSRILNNVVLSSTQTVCDYNYNLLLQKICELRVCARQALRAKPEEYILRPN